MDQTETCNAQDSAQDMGAGVRWDEAGMTITAKSVRGPIKWTYTANCITNNPRTRPRERPRPVREDDYCTEDLRWWEPMPPAPKPEPLLTLLRRLVRRLRLSLGIRRETEAL